MKLTVFGATGGTGQQLVSQALAAGCAVTALVRHPALGKSQSGLTFLSGDTHDSEAVGRAVAGNDAVLCALGGRPWRRSENVCSSAMPNIIDAMHKHSVRRIIAISTFGAGDSRPQAPWLARALIFGFILRTEVADKEAMEAQLSSSGVDWTVVRVGVLAGEGTCSRGTATLPHATSNQP